MSPGVPGSRRSWKDLIAATAEASEVPLGGDSAMEDMEAAAEHVLHVLAAFGTC